MFIEINEQVYNILSIVSCRPVNEINELDEVSYNLVYEDDNGHILIEKYTTDATRQARITYIQSITFGGGGEGGTTNYNILSNKPQINNVTLIGNLTGESFGLQDKLTAGDNITIEGNVISAQSGEAGTKNYNELTNRPTLNGVTIEGTKTSNDYGIVIPDVSNLATKEELTSKQDTLTNVQLNNIDDVPNKANTDYVDTELATKQDTLSAQQITNINAVPNKANTDYVNTELDKKQNNLSQSQLDNIDDIPNKVDKVYVDDELTKKQDTLTSEQLNNIDDVSNKANTVYVDEELSKKQNTLTNAQIININDVPNKQNKLVAGENIEIDPDTNVISATGGGSTGDYNSLINKPTLNDVEISGAKTSADYNINIPDISGLATKEELATKQDTLTSAQITNIDAVPNKANTDYVNTELDKKQNSLTQTQITNIDAIPNKADTTVVNSQLANKQDLLSASQIAGIDDIPNKANKTYVDEQLATKQDTLIAGANITIDPTTNTISSSGGSGGTSDYTALTSKPQINGVELNGNKTTSDLGIVIPTLTSELNNDSGFVEDSAYVHTDNNFTTLEKDKLNNLENYDDTVVKADITALQTNKADKTELPTNTSDLINDSNFVVDANYVHTDNNFTTDEKTKLSGLNNTVVVQTTGESITDVMSQAGVTGALMDKVDKVAGKTLTSNDYTNEDKSKLDLMFNYDDTEVRAEITALETTKADKATTYTKEEIDAQRSGVYRFMGSVATYADLPTTGNTNGDVYNTTDTDANFAWDGAEWDGLGSTIDLTAYALKSYVDDMKAELLALIDTKLDKDTIKVLSTTSEYDALTPEEKLETIAFIEEV